MYEVAGITREEHVVVYYVIALALYMQSSYRDPSATMWRAGRGPKATGIP